MGEEYKMLEIQAALKRWEKSSNGTNAIYCPVCKREGHTLIVHSDEKYITGICAECSSAGRILKSNLGEE